LPCVIARATMEVVKADDTQIRMLTPAVLRQSLRKAGKLMKPCEVAAILSMSQMSVLRTCMVCTLHTCALVMSLACPGKASKKARRVPRSSSLRATSALQLLELMCFNKAVLLEPSVAWEKLARFPHLTVIHLASPI